MPSILKCIKCGNTNISFIQNVCVEKEFAINKNNTVSKKPKYNKMHEIADSKGFVYCNVCEESMDFEIDNKGRIIELKEW